MREKQRGIATDKDKDRDIEIGDRDRYKDREIGDRMNTFFMFKTTTSKVNYGNGRFGWLFEENILRLSEQKGIV